MANQRFQQGSGCYQCSSCKKMTRAVLDDAADLGLCSVCYEAAGIENEHQDGHHRDNPNPDCPLCRVAEESEEDTEKEE